MTLEPAAIALDDLRAYARTFFNRWDAVLIGTSNGEWRCTRQSLTEMHLRHAVAGNIGLGAYAVSRNGLSRWACLDLDDNVRGDHFLEVIAALPDPNATLLEYSRRGFHLWIFVEPCPWFVVQHWARTSADQANLGGIEVFPKGDGLNGVRLPLSRHPKTGLVYPLIDAGSGEIVTDPLAFIRSRDRIDLVDHALSTSAPPSSPVWERRTLGSSDHRALADEIERHTHLRFYGAEQAIGRCPLHDDRRPSLGVLGGYWRCFAGCGEGGLNAFRARMREKGGR